MLTWLYKAISTNLQKTLRRKAEKSCSMSAFDNYVCFESFNSPEKIPMDTYNSVFTFDEPSDFFFATGLKRLHSLSSFAE